MLAVLLAIGKCKVAAVAMLALWVAVLIHKVGFQGAFKTKGFVAVVAAPAEMLMLRVQVPDQRSLPFVRSSAQPAGVPCAIFGMDFLNVLSQPGHRWERNFDFAKVACVRTIIGGKEGHFVVAQAHWHETASYTDRADPVDCNQVCTVQQG